VQRGSIVSSCCGRAERPRNNGNQGCRPREQEKTPCGTGRDEHAGNSEAPVRETDRKEEPAGERYDEVTASGTYGKMHDRVPQRDRAQKERQGDWGVNQPE